MNVAVLFFIVAIVGIGAQAFSKLRSNMVAQNSVSKYSFVLIVNSIVSCVFFLISSGFKISVNKLTLLYSLIYALVVAVSIISNVIVYRYASISNVNVVSNACGMVCTAGIGWILFSENLGAITLLRLAVMLVAMFFVFLDQKGKNVSAALSVPSKKSSMIALISVIAVITLCGCANTVILKFFAMSKDVTDEISFFFLTNVILCVVTGIVFVVACLRKKGEFRDSILLLRPKRLVSIAGNTICSNISSILSVLIVAQMDVSIYSPISSAIGIMIGVVVSVMFREKLGVFSYIAAAIACIAVII